MVNGKGIFVPVALGALEGLRATKGRVASSFTSVAVDARWIHLRMRCLRLTGRLNIYKKGMFSLLLWQA